MQMDGFQQQLKSSNSWPATSGGVMIGTIHISKVAFSLQGSNNCGSPEISQSKYCTLACGRCKPEPPPTTNATKPSPPPLVNTTAPSMKYAAGLQPASEPPSPAVQPASEAFSLSLTELSPLTTAKTPASEPPATAAQPAAPSAEAAKASPPPQSLADALARIAGGGASNPQSPVSAPTLNKEFLLQHGHVPTCLYHVACMTLQSASLHVPEGYLTIQSKWKVSCAQAASPSMTPMPTMPSPPIDSRPPMPALTARTIVILSNVNTNGSPTPPENAQPPPLSPQPPLPSPPAPTQPLPSPSPSMQPPPSPPPAGDSCFDKQFPGVYSCAENKASGARGENDVLLGEFLLLPSPNSIWPT